jgi:hypothetical protein
LNYKKTKRVRNRFLEILLDSKTKKMNFQINSLFMKRNWKI